MDNLANWTKSKNARVKIDDVRRDYSRRKLVLWRALVEKRPFLRHDPRNWTACSPSFVHLPGIRRVAELPLP